MNKLAVHPGQHLEELLYTYDMTTSYLSLALDVSEDIIINIINGKESITHSIASGLSRMFPYQARIWVALQKDYDESIAELRNANE